ncbi:hypothetical protein FD755_013737 [Muntiacus reevesi]|uniref:Immunoglobulin V-set domain-containing protein n=1 Tax=Muntiacus reevesi TaxID=9886 RepID=A0A5N3XMF5_MUNRE|nr:hypothetical protein FD755_013737 [Muntiacus reevesi]
MEMHVRSSLVVLWLHFCCKLMKSFSQNCTFQCNYTVSPFNNLRWYTQDTGRGPVPLITMTYSDNRKSNGRYTATVDAIAKLSSLHLTDAQLGTCTLYPNLHLEVVKEQFLKCCV